MFNWIQKMYFKHVILVFYVSYKPKLHIKNTQFMYSKDSLGNNAMMMMEMIRDVEVHRPLESAAALLVESPLPPPPPPPSSSPALAPPSYPHPSPPPISPRAPCPPRSFAGFLSHHHPQGSAQHRNFIQNNWDTIVNRSIYGMHNIIIISVTDSQCFSHIIWLICWSANKNLENVENKKVLFWLTTRSTTKDLI